MNSAQNRKPDFDDLQTSSSHYITIRMTHTRNHPTTHRQQTTCVEIHPRLFSKIADFPHRWGSWAKAPKLLEDIRDAAAFVCDSVRGLTQAEYEGNRLLRQAVERNFEIIGEALNRLDQVDSQTAARVGPVTQIKAFCNVFVHAYDSIDHAIVWDVIQNKLPPLLANVEQLLDDTDDAAKS